MGYWEGLHDSVQSTRPGADTGHRRLRRALLSTTAFGATTAVAAAWSCSMPAVDGDPKPAGSTGWTGSWAGSGWYHPIFMLVGLQCSRTMMRGKLGDLVGLDEKSRSPS